MVADRDLDTTSRTVEAVADAGGEAYAARADVTSSCDLARFARETRERPDRIDVLHNDVGIAKTGVPIETSEAS